MQTALASHESGASTVPESERAALRRIQMSFWGVAVVFGFLQAWSNRHVMNSDGICYLDLADAYLAGGWKMLLNGHWSPLYPWLLAVAKAVVKPSSYWEFTLVHMVNFLTYVLALGSFELMLRQLIASCGPGYGHQDDSTALPEWALRVIGYLIFLWLSLGIITLERKSPDMLMSAFVYLTSAVLLKIRNGANSWYLYPLLGLFLGVGYLAKAPMFPMAFVFLGVALFSSGSLRRSLIRVSLAFLSFLLVSAPFLIGLSEKAGRLTFGDSGTWNYIALVNGAGPVWYMQDLGTARGKLLHPPQKIFEFPPVYSFTGPLGGTLPAWYYPSYWIEGAKPHFVLRSELAAISKNSAEYRDLFFGHDIALVTALLILWITGHALISLRSLLRLWPVWVPALVALGMYWVVLVQGRYVAVFFVVIWAALFCSVRLPKREEFRRLAVGVTVALLFSIGAPLTLSAAKDFHEGVRHRSHPQWEVAKQLRRMGVNPGDSVGRIGGHWRVEWARLAGLRVIAEIPREQAEYFWSSSPVVQSQVIESFRSTGATAIVAHQMQPFEVFVPPSGWQRIGESEFYVYLLRNDKNVAAIQTIHQYR